MFVYIVEQKTSKGWEVYEEPVGYHMAINAWGSLVSNGVEARLTALKFVVKEEG